MRAQDEKIKGFSLLELLVVVVIIGVISGVGYPKFNEWRIDRETRSSVIKIKSLFDGINAQVKRGQYAFVQVHIKEESDSLHVTSKGMKPAKLASLINDSTSTWWSDINSRCNTDETAYWDDDPHQGRNSIEVRQIVLDNIATTWTKKTVAVCFGKNERWFSATSNFTSSPPPPKEEEGGGLSMQSMLNSPSNQLIVCRRTSTQSQCDQADPSASEQSFKIEWSRFGNVKLEKWDKRNGSWTLQ
jgi:prepilin-type N-terminal cleavage/methylation domain-containing protein